MMTTLRPLAEIGTSSTPRSPSWARFAQRQVLHRLVDAVELAARDRQVASLGGARGDARSASKDSRSFSTVTSTPTSTPAAELGALGAHLGQATVEDPLLHLELGDAVAEQPTDAVGPLVDDDAVTGPGQLLRRGETGGTGADDGDGLLGEAARTAPGGPNPRPRPGR